MQHLIGAAAVRPCTERTVWRQLRSRATASLCAAIVLAAPLACSRGADRVDDDPTVSVASEAGAAAATRVAAAGDSSARAKPICPATGHWQLCSVVERLERAGLAPRQDSGRVTEAPLSTPGVAIQLGRSELRVFVYADRAARERDEGRLDKSKYVRATEPLSIGAQPTLITSDNLLAILRSRNDHQRERVSDALTAGPPQTPGTKG